VRDCGKWQAFDAEYRNSRTITEGGFAWHRKGCCIANTPNLGVSALNGNRDSSSRQDIVNEFKKLFATDANTSHSGRLISKRSFRPANMLAYKVLHHAAEAQISTPYVMLLLPLPNLFPHEPLYRSSLSISLILGSPHQTCHDDGDL
jgi:hypothetical protein